jgi:hypothetical protein
MLLSGRLQGCISSAIEEFLERIDQSGVVVDQIPETVRAQLCRFYYDNAGRPTEHQTKELHKKYAILWTPGSALPPGTLKPDSLGDDGNPWPDRVQGLMKRCDVDLYARVTAQHGAPYLDDLKDYVGELMKFRNAVAHGDNPASTWSAGDVRLRMTWAIRLARACDAGLGAKLATITGTGW